MLNGFTVVAASNASPQQIKKELTALQKQIQKFEQKMTLNQTEEKKLVTTLSQLEKKIGDQTEILRTLQQKISFEKNHCKELGEQLKTLQTQQSAQFSALGKLVQSAFMQQQTQPFFLMNPQENLSQTRLRQYYHFYYLGFDAQIKHLLNELNKVKQIQLEHTTAQQKLSQLMQAATFEVSQLKQIKNQREIVLTQLTKENQTLDEKMAQLKQQTEQLNTVFQSLEQKLSLNKNLAQHTLEFAKMKSLLPFPINDHQASLSTLPHAANQGKKTYISAKSGTPVQAIFDGRVVFAEWLRGVGLLLILDHGNGYLSLYGNNQKLYKQLGDIVTQGEMISRVGQSGGHSEPGLYFEIRKDGEALDPTPWFQQTAV